MASKQGGSGADKNVDFRDSSMDELTDTDCDDQDVAQNIFDEKRTINDDLPLDTTVSSDSFGYITISNLS